MCIQYTEALGGVKKKDRVKTAVLRRINQKKKSRYRVSAGLAFIKSWTGNTSDLRAFSRASSFSVSLVSLGMLRTCPGYICRGSLI